MLPIRDISQLGIQLIEHFECSGDVTKFLHAYQDTGGVWTIGIGTIRYPDGTKVKQGDVITVVEAREYLAYDLNQAMLDVDALTVDTLEQHQFDALTSFVYNCGQNGYRTSTLRKLINSNRVDYKNIVPEFQKWQYDNGKKIDGLLRRRKAEAYLYTYGENKFYFTNNDNII